jgi:hypothetical protein
VPADASNYHGGSVSSTIDVAKATPSVIIAGGSYIYDGTAHPAGRILFMVDGQVVGDPSGIEVTPLSGSTARATFTVTGLKHGHHQVTATYLGESIDKGSTALVTQTVN